MLKHAAKHHIDSFNFAIDTLLLKRLPSYLDEVHIDTPHDSQIHPFHHLSYRFSKFQISKPEVKEQCTLINDSHKLFPVQCRQRRLTYSALLQAYIERTTDHITTDTFKVKLGYIPVMIGSSLCHLDNMNGKQLINAHQDPTQFGGYFLINGIERIVRMLIAQKKNYPIAFKRGGFVKRGNNFSQYAVSMRCVRSGDLFTQTITLHYLNDGSVILRLIIQKAEYLIPLGIILKALGGRNVASRKEFQDIYGEVTDLQIFKAIVTPHIDPELDSEQNDQQNSLMSFMQQMSQKVESFLSQHRNMGLFSGKQCRQYLGSRFKIMMNVDGLDLNDQEIGTRFIQNHICVHAQQFSDKLNILCVMVQKLYCFYNGIVGPDNLDALSTHECLLSGHIYFMLMRENLAEVLQGVKSRIARELLGGSTQKKSKKTEDLNHFVEQQEAQQEERQKKKNIKLSQEKIATSTAKLRSKQFLIQAFDSYGKMFANKLNYFLATGNLVSKTNLDLQQTAGFTVVADKLNSIRYLSHFRSIHRGHYFTEMKTTQVRKLLPESWGFLCPVHTPDGAPCGLLNHISMACYPIAKEDYNREDQPENQLDVIGRQFSPSSGDQQNDRQIRSARKQIKSPTQFKALISSLLKTSLNQTPTKGIPVILDGILLYYVPSTLSSYLANALRLLKSSSDSESIPYNIPIHTEITHIPLPSSPSLKSPLFPGIFISTSISRFLRPVRNLISGSVEWISPLQQITLPIACLQEDIRPDVTHQQLSPSIILSIVASTTPFSDFNQSPRNMYQCQMAKQTMGTSTHNLKYRADNKSYRILTPQLPLVRTQAFQEWDFAQHPSGTNAVVAVISYTGYDMEDAMIINKMAYQRGFAHGCVYKTNTRRLNQGGRGGLSQGISGDGGLQYRLIESDSDRKMMDEAINNNRFLSQDHASAS